MLLCGVGRIPRRPGFDIDNDFGIVMLIMLTMLAIM